MAHVPAGGELHLLVLQMEARLGEAVPVADMVVVQMGDDDVLDLLGVDAEMGQQVGRDCVLTSRPRFLPTWALKPVSITIGLPPMRAVALSSSGIATQTK